MKRKKLIRYTLMFVLAAFLFTTFVSIGSVFYFTNPKETAPAKTAENSSQTKTGEINMKNSLNEPPKTENSTQKTPEQPEKAVYAKVDGVKFTKTDVSEKDTQSALAWSDSKSAKLQASVGGKGESGEEEGIGKIFIKNKETNSIYSLVLDGMQNFTPKQVAWIDENRLAVIIGYGYGTTSKGGSLYSVDINTGEVNSIYKVKSDLETVASVKAAEGKIELEIHTYKDSNQKDYDKSTKLLEI